jgi:hypothetical protein
MPHAMDVLNTILEHLANLNPAASEALSRRKEAGVADRSTPV